MQARRSRLYIALISMVLGVAGCGDDSQNQNTNENLNQNSNENLNSNQNQNTNENLNTADYEGPLDALDGHYAISTIVMGEVGDPQVITTSPAYFDLDNESVFVGVTGSADLTSTSANQGALKLRWGLFADTMLAPPYSIRAADWSVSFDSSTSLLLVDDGGEGAVYGVHVDSGVIHLTLDVNDPRNTATAPPLGFELTPQPVGSNPLAGEWLVNRQFLVSSIGGTFELTRECGAHGMAELPAPYGILYSTWSIDPDGYFTKIENVRTWDASNCPGAPDSSDHQFSETMIGFILVDPINGEVSIYADTETPYYNENVRLVWEGDYSLNAPNLSFSVTAQMADHNYGWWHEIDLETAP